MLRIEGHCRNQPYRTMLVLYKPLLSLEESFKELCIHNKMKHFGYESGCGIHDVARHLKEKLICSIDE